MEEALKARRDVPEALKWDLTLLYKNEEAFLKDLDSAKAIAEQICPYRGHLTAGNTIAECVQLFETYTMKKTILTCYAAMAVSADCTDVQSLERDAQVSSIFNALDSDLDFIESEIGEADGAVIREAALLVPRCAGFLKEILRGRPHRLHPEAERVLAAFTEAMETPYAIYEQMKLSDITFDPFEVNGVRYPLDYSLFEDSYEYDSRTDVRRAAFHGFSKAVRRYENATACAYNSEVRRQKTDADLRGFDNVFESLLFSQHVTREMYDRQIDLIMEQLAPHMRRYASIIKRVYGLREMTFADLKAPIDADHGEAITIDRAREMIRGALNILGEDYLKTVDAAFDERWIDFGRNIGKSTGGFCDSPYGKNSYILMTWNGRMSDVFTLAHELGHAGHFAACNAAQSIFDTDVSTYFVESPSTMNELLLGQYLLKNAKDAREKRFILSRMVGDTYYHNCVTHLIEAAYQREVYRIIDAGGSVHAEVLNDIMGRTLRAFWGDAVLIDEDAERTWMRQPHYYMGLYPYTYSAGLTVATAVANRISQGDTSAVEDWKRVLRAGSTLDPTGLAALAHVDITTDGPLKAMIGTIGRMIDEIEDLTDEIEGK